MHRDQMPASLHIRRYPGLTPYLPVYDAMREFTARRDAHTMDELWMVQHPPVYTLGLAGKRAHLIDPGRIPVYHVDRGGQVTYHGPGQVVVYALLDLKRLGLHVKALVHALEQAVIEQLAGYGIHAQRRDKAPGVYVNEAKIAALGLRIRHGFSYHGLSLNVDLDLAPFQGINPCGYEGLTVTRLTDLGINLPLEQVAEDLLSFLRKHLGYPI